MKRIVLTDDSGKWFDGDKTIDFCEDTDWNGNNHISKATGSQWDHQKLKYTKGGSWVLWESSQWQGSTDSYTEVLEMFAIRWLITQCCVDDDNIEKLPKSVQEAVANGIELAEM
tara:strand:- start:38 stop:379 length:342 start_codon:yes stop_codon:yes gene_type:complete